MSKKAEPILTEDFDLFLEREVILAAGTPNTGKSYTIAELILASKEGGFQVHVIDRDRGLGKALKELGMTALPSGAWYTKAVKWDDVERGTDLAMELLGQGDWLCLDMMGEFWDLAQTAYSERVYGDDLTTHILALRAEAEEKIREASLEAKSKGANAERSRATGYNALDGRTDWNLIKRMHNINFRDRLIKEGDFNILATTAAVPFKTEGSKDAVEYPDWARSNVRPTGEKHNQYAFDTWVLVEKREGKYVWSTALGNKGDGKDRGGRLLSHPITRRDFTGVGLIQAMEEAFQEEGVQ